MKPATAPSFPVARPQHVAAFRRERDRTAWQDHLALKALRCNGFDPLAAIHAYPKLVAALRAISEAQEVSGDSFVCDFSTLQSIAEHALRELGE